MKKGHRYVLIVDDSPAVRLFLTRYFTQEGCAVGCASTCSEALNQLSSGTYDLIFMDCDIERASDGIELAKKIRGLQPKLNIILMSGDPLNAVAAQKAKFDVFLGKPILITDLKKAVR